MGLEQVGAVAGVITGPMAAVMDMALPAKPLAHADMATVGEDLSVPPLRGPISVLAHGELPDVEPRRSASVRNTGAEQASVPRRAACREQRARP